jgi:hypothetical protein
MARDVLQPLRLRVARDRRKVIDAKLRPAKRNYRLPRLTQFN